MKKIITLVACVLALAVILPGCAKKAESPEAAIKKAQSMSSVDDQVDYLTEQAKLFCDSKEYKEAVTLSQHVLTQLDAESEDAQEILEDAKKELSSAVGGALKKIGIGK